MATPFPRAPLPRVHPSTRLAAWRVGWVAMAAALAVLWMPLLGALHVGAERTCGEGGAIHGPLGPGIAAQDCEGTVANPDRRDRRDRRVDRTDATSAASIASERPESSPAVPAAPPAPGHDARDCSFCDHLLHGSQMALSAAPEPSTGAGGIRSPTPGGEDAPARSASYPASSPRAPPVAG